MRQSLFDMLVHAPWGGRTLLEGAAVLDVFAGTGLGGNTTTIPSVTLTYTAVPEPVSSSVLLVGLAGLGFIRRKIRPA